MRCKVMVSEQKGPIYKCYVLSLFSPMFAEAVAAIKRGVDEGGGGGREVGERENTLKIAVHLVLRHPGLFQPVYKTKNIHRVNLLQILFV